MKLHALALLACLAIPAYAQPQAPADALREERAAQREFQQDRGYDQRDHRPRWCYAYDRRDYWQEKRDCGKDWQCRARANRKAERCGLR